MAAANKYVRVKTTRGGIPEYLYNLDKDRYKDEYMQILKIEKAKKKKKKKLKIKKA